MNERQQEHANDALRLLERLRQANGDSATPPSTSDLQREEVFGLRPVNRVGNLRELGYDIEGIKCAHGVWRWKLHEPPRPLDKQEWRNRNQRCLPIHTPQKNASSESDYMRRRREEDAAAAPLFAAVRS